MDADVAVFLLDVLSGTTLSAPVGEFPRIADVYQRAVDQLTAAQEVELV